MKDNQIQGFHVRQQALPYPQPTLSPQQSQLLNRKNNGEIGDRAWIFLGGEDMVLAGVLSEVIQQTPGTIEILCLQNRYNGNQGFFKLKVNQKEQAILHKF